MKILLIDNYDSFTYNLVHYMEELGVDVQVERNDFIAASEISDVIINIDKIVISPGPGTPADSGICTDIIKKCNIPIFGVCLGHQVIGEVFGAKIIRNDPMHGKISAIFHKGQGIFADIPSPFKATRYHSLIIEDKNLPDCLSVTARTKDNIIMGISHKIKNIYGVQFHPESILSEYGHKILENFLKM